MRRKPWTGAAGLLWQPHICGRCISVQEQQQQQQQQQQLFVRFTDGMQWHFRGRVLVTPAGELQKSTVLTSEIPAANHAQLSSECMNASQFANTRTGFGWSHGTLLFIPSRNMHSCYVQRTIPLLSLVYSWSV